MSVARSETRLQWLIVLGWSLGGVALQCFGVFEMVFGWCGLGRFGVNLCAVLERSSSGLEASWGGLWGLWSRLGASEARKGDNVKNIEKYNENQWF